MHYHYKLNTDEVRNWDRLGLAVKKRAKFKCECCSSSKGESVHHIFYRGYAKEIPDDLLFVCNSCHTKLHRFYKFDDRYNPLDDITHLYSNDAIKMLGKQYNFMLKFSSAFYTKLRNRHDEVDYAEEAEL